MKLGAVDPDPANRSAQRRCGKSCARCSIAKLWWTDDATDYRTPDRDPASGRSRTCASKKRERSHWRAIALDPTQPEAYTISFGALLEIRVTLLEA